MITPEHLEHLFAAPIADSGDHVHDHEHESTPIWKQLMKSIQVGEDEEQSIEDFVSHVHQWSETLGTTQHKLFKQYVVPVLSKRLERLEQGLETVERLKLEDVLFIGDVHGRLDKVHALVKSEGAPCEYTQWVFVGDLIDNGQTNNVDHVGLLNTIKEWVEQGTAQVVMGNHELNAIGWLLNNEHGVPCRPHTPNKRKQHAVFLEQVGENSEQHHAWVEWFKTLPLYLNLGSIRAIHACWHQESIDKLQPYLNADNSLKAEHWQDAFTKGHELYELLEILLKGPEVKLPEGYSFLDKNDIERKEIRVAWWEQPDHLNNYRDLAVVADDQRQRIPDCAFDQEALKYNQALDLPVVVGHYTLGASNYPDVLSPKVVCVDFNAARDDNKLVGYYANVSYWPEENRTQVRDFVFADAPIPERMITYGAGVMIELAMSQVPEATQNEEFEQVVADILFKEWDPCGVYYGVEEIDEQMCGEYAGYEEDAARLAQFGDVNLLAAFLYLKETQSMGLSGDHRGCAKVAEKLVATWLSLNK